MSQELNNEFREVDFKDIVIAIFARKILILFITSLVTALGLLNVSLIQPTYSTISKFNQPDESSIFKLVQDNKYIYNSRCLIYECGDNVDLNSKQIFSAFLQTVTSADFQKKVFLEGDHLNLFNPTNEPIEDIDAFITGQLSGVTLHRPKKTKQELQLGFLDKMPYSLSIEGSYPNAIPILLNDLVNKASIDTIASLKKVTKLKVDSLLEDLELERKSLLSKKNEHTKSSKLLIEKLNATSETSNMIIFNYLYADISTYSTKLFEIDSEILKIESAIKKLRNVTYDYENLSAISIHSTSERAILRDEKKSFTITLFFIAGFMMSILIAATLNFFQRSN